MRLSSPAQRHRAISGISSSERPKRMQAGNMSTGKTIPVTMPKTARGFATASASRFGTSICSRVEMPDLAVSARARGPADCSTRRPMGVHFPLGICCRTVSAVSISSVRQLPMALPRITHRQARPASLPAQKCRQTRVTVMEKSCSATSTTAKVPIRFWPVKKPVIRAHRQLMGRKHENSRSAGATAPFPIQLSAIFGAKRYRTVPTPRLQRML